MLSIKNLEAGYGKLQVLHGIAMKVSKGKVVTLIGSNGASKTTTMCVVSGMIQPMADQINLHGKRIAGWSRLPSPSRAWHIRLKATVCLPP